MPGKREAPPDYGRGGRKRTDSRRPQQDAYFEQPRRKPQDDYSAPPRRKPRDDDYDVDATRRYDSRSSGDSRRTSDRRSTADRRRQDYERDYSDFYDDRRSGRDSGGYGGRGGDRRPPVPPSNNGKRPRKHQRKRRMPRWQKVVITILVVIIALLVAAIAVVNGKLGRINRIQDQDRISSADQSYDQDATGPDTLSDDAINFGNAKVLEDQNVINILLVGRDSRDLSDRGRSDSMIVVSMNRNTKQISMVSLMRDCYVQIPGYKNNKMNAAFQYGGYDLLDETISQNFGIQIDYNVGVNFSGFEQVVDKLGGIDITLTQDEALYLMADEDTLAENLVEGVNHLNGKEALGYARARYVSTGKEANDFGRTYRQRMVMTTVYKELMQKSLPEIWSILDSIMDCVETDMTNAQIVSMGTEFYNMDINTMQSYRIPSDGEYTDQTINKMMVLVPDFEAAQKHLQEWLYSDTPVADHSLETAN